MIMRQADYSNTVSASAEVESGQLRTPSGVLFGAVFCRIYMRVG